MIAGYGKTRPYSANCAQIIKDVGNYNYVAKVIMKFNVKETGNRIRLARETRGLTVQQLAALISCSPDHLYKTESGLRGMSTDLLYSISAELNVSMNYLTNCPIHDDNEIVRSNTKKRLEEVISILNEIICESG